MNKKILAIAILIVMGSTALMAYSGGSRFSNGIASIIENMETAPLSEDETSGILLMREEEKLARDVYLTLYDKWGLRTFSNIAGAESTHMDAMGLLIKRYNLEDPVKSDKIGEFTNPEMKNLYNTLVEQGSKSFADALKVGATIEDLDIYDLERLIASSDNDDVKVAYQNLLKGSRNHMRSFGMQLNSNGVEYSAQYISNADMEKILNSNAERGIIISNPNFKF